MSIVFFDMETGGLKPEHPVISLAAIAVGNDWSELGSFERRIQFDEATADQEALKLNGYTAEKWADAVPEVQVVKGFAEFLKDHCSLEMMSARTGNPYYVAQLAGHNAPGFDAPRLKAMFERHKAFLPAHPLVLDTMQLAMWRCRLSVKVENMKLATLCKHCGVELAEAHTALADCRAAAAIAKVMAS